MYALVSFAAGAAITYGVMKWMSAASVVSAPRKGADSHPKSKPKVSSADGRIKMVLVVRTDLKMGVGKVCAGPYCDGVMSTTRFL
jgi:hypothetical protein